MKNNWISKVVIFVAGAAAGGVVASIVTRQVVDKTYRDAADEEIHEATQLCNEKIKGYKEEIKQLNEKIARQKVTINTLADQVRESGGGEKLDDILEDDDSEDDPRLRAAVTKVKSKDPESEREKQSYRRYSGRYRTSEADELTPEDQGEEDEDSIRANSPRLISEDAFSTTAIDYSKEDLYYYIYDGKVISEDDEEVKNFRALTGDFAIGNSGDEIYIRNDELAVDYHIMFQAAFSEEHISHSDIWGED